MFCITSSNVTTFYFILICICLPIKTNTLQSRSDSSCLFSDALHLRLCMRATTRFRWRYFRRMRHAPGGCTQANRMIWLIPNYIRFSNEGNRGKQPLLLTKCFQSIYQAPGNWSKFQVTGKYSKASRSLGPYTPAQVQRGE